MSETAAADFYDIELHYHHNQHLKNHLVHQNYSITPIPKTELSLTCVEEGVNFQITAFLTAGSTAA
jgi:hypothetical protein